MRVEGWQYAGRLLGIVPIVESLLRVDPDSAPAACRYEAKVSLLDYPAGHQQWARALPFAQTRSRAKSFISSLPLPVWPRPGPSARRFRNSLAWLMREAGFEATPAEEMAYSAPATALTQAPALATNGAAARVTVPTAQQLPAIAPGPAVGGHPLPRPRPPRQLLY